MALRPKHAIWLFAALAGLPLLISGLPRERARFLAAAGRNAEWAGDLPRAIEIVGRAIAREPQEPLWLVQRAELLLKLNRASEALRDLLRAEQLPGRPVRLDDVFIEALLQAGRHTEALRRWEREHPPIEVPPAGSTDATLLERLLRHLFGSEPGAARNRLLAEQASRRNTRAYFRALAGVDLDDARQDAEAAVAFAADDRILADPLGFLLLAAGASYRGTHATRQGLHHLRHAVRRLRETAHRRQLRASALRSVMAPRDRERATRQVEVTKAMLVQAHVTLYHEYRERGSEAAARRQLDWARRIGGDDLDPEELAWELPLDHALLRVERLAAYLDTLATVQWKQGQLDEALRSMEQAIELGEAAHQATAWWLEWTARQQIDLRQERQQAGRQSRSLAIYYYRRSLIRAARGDDRGAAADQQRVRDLGFQPTDSLK